MSCVRAFESTILPSTFSTSGVHKTATTRPLLHYPTRLLYTPPLTFTTSLGNNILYGPSFRRIASIRCFSALTPELKTTLDKVVTSSKVVLFMKGTKEFPQCGFSNTVVQILKSLNAPFETINILENEILRQGLKEYSSWPTFPQLYIEGEFFGGCDITVEAYKSGQLQEQLEKAMCS
ncbi:monothiol glutaredoxin-S7, chloroplastic [Alnus glutinosa]|uniref:monothiol glutaredoxin-S7, chloroplastic n=1 Tax=Alnus glutinosa TaxID=3517 RepID=UPI002D772D75|nr:monothiol glutaredoxin-S7, chloroplastic [Alnus glutinosa]